jgi:ATP-binding cassette subfamily C protein CydC
MVLAIILSCGTVASNITLLGFAAYLIAAATIVPYLALLTLPIYIVRFMSVTRAVSRYSERLVAHNVTFQLLARLRTWVYSRLEPLAPAQLQTFRSGDVLTRLVADIEELQNIYLRVISPVIVAAVIGVFTFGLFSIFSSLLAWVALTFLAVTGFGVPLLSTLLTRRLGQQQLSLRAELNAQIVDNIQGVQDLLACGATESRQRKIRELGRAIGKVQERLALVAGLQQMLNDFLKNLALWTLLVLTIPLVTSQAINGVYLALLALVILSSFEAVQPLGQAFQFLGHSLAAADRVYKLADEKPQVVDPAAALPAPSGPGLVFDQVHFAYQFEEGEVLKGVSFALQPGSRIAVVGPSGVGKSTLVNLAVRFWDPSQGTIKLDGQDIRNYALSDLRGAISVVDQNTHLFAGTLRDNLLVARPEASPKMLEQVLEQVQLAAFIKQLPLGLDTWIGEQGLRLSGGERQRLAIARALLKDSPLLILDEPTANLDPLTEQALLLALEGLMSNRTTLIITHRLVWMETMDQILVFDGGEIYERGTHEQLMRLGGLYRRMVDVQAGMLV